MLETALGIFAIWLAWTIAQVFIETREWVWWGLLLGTGVAYQVVFLDPSYWWLGLGIGGAAAFLGLVADVLLLVGDLARVHVLRNRSV
jgi:hypothetical protein